MVEVLGRAIHETLGRISLLVPTSSAVDRGYERFVCRFIAAVAAHFLRASFLA